MKNKDAWPLTAARQKLLIENVHRIMRERYKGVALWSFISDITGHGCGYSHDILRGKWLGRRSGRIPPDYAMKKYTSRDQILKDIDAALAKVQKAKVVAQEHLDQEALLLGMTSLTELRAHREAADPNSGRSNGWRTSDSKCSRRS